MLYNKSPLFFSEKISKPLLVIQGANDLRAPQSESDFIVARVRKNGTPVEYLIFDDEGHGVRKPENIIETLKTISTFLNTYLKEKKDEN
jgi:dipeptidyl aminopeptidase/acylaminoacyl peptidase